MPTLTDPQQHLIDSAANGLSHPQTKASFLADVESRLEEFEAVAMTEVQEIVYGALGRVPGILCAGR
jgi:hypothetical protein